MEQAYHTPSEASCDRRATYASLQSQVSSLVSGERNFIGVLANVSSLLRMTFGERFFWVGFYLVSEGKLRLGPFQGTMACFTIEQGRGVCGTAWARNESIIVDDVEQFPGHIACSSESRSEIVVPLHDASGAVTGVLDIDSRETGAFDLIDREGLEAVCRLLDKEKFDIQWL
ncbi:MAG: GAF domain-containing protein [Prevotella sp.]|nr:GAF domain-containing protein [Prevotella sp.]